MPPDSERIVGQAEVMREAIHAIPLAGPEVRIEEATDMLSYRGKWQSVSRGLKRATLTRLTYFPIRSHMNKVSTAGGLSSEASTLNDIRLGP